MLNRITLWEIAGNPDDIEVTFGGPDTLRGMYAGWITRGPGHRYKTLVSTPAIFKTPEEAVEEMQKIVDFANKWTEEDLKDPNNPIAVFIKKYQEEFVLVQEIIEKAKAEGKFGE